MRISRVFFLLMILTIPFYGIGQELKANVTILSNRVSNKIDRKIFTTLQNGLTNFINNRKWTNDVYQTNEKIECSFLINIVKDIDQNIYTASLTVQAARPVFNSSYNSPIINWQDQDLAFRYIEFQPIEFNENRVTGNDPLVSNLTAVLAYYIYTIIGLDYDSFSPRGGDPYFAKAQNIVNNAPEGRNISGWRAFDGIRNRYWLMENLLNSKYTIVHDAYYSYYREGMDKLYENPAEARNGIMQALNSINILNAEYRNTMVQQFFFQGKSQELINIFSQAPPDERKKASNLLQVLDISNASTYKDQLK